MILAVIFLIGLAVGYVARRYAFCIFGAILELLSLGSGRRLLGVVAAMVVFGLVQRGAYQHGLEAPGPKYFVGGLLQGVGYFLAMGCPLSLLVRLGEGSKFHLVVFAGFVLGVAIYSGVLNSLVESTLGAMSTDRIVTVPDLFR